MTIDELYRRAQACQREKRDLLLTLGRKPRGNTIRLCGRRGPCGTVVCVSNKGSTVASFDANRVVEFLRREIRKLNADD